MNDKFLPKDPVSSKLEITEILYERLIEVRRASALIALNEFDAGINCRCADEEKWLESLLDMIERS
jgi:hypothetical protein